MFSKSVCVALLGLSLSAFMTEASPILGGGKNEDCAPPKTIIKTVTVTARAATNTGKASTGATTGNSGSSKGSTGNTGATKGSTSSSSGSKGTTSSSTGSKGTTSSSTGSKGTTSSSTGSKGTTSTGSKGTTSSSNTGSKGSTGSTGSKGTTTTAKGSTSTSISKGNQAVNAGAAGSGANNAGSGAAGGDPQTSLTLDPRVIATGFKNNGQAVPTAGQVASLTSGNNFINFCLTVPNTPITNGKQIVTGSCNPSPIGVIPNVDTMPSSKFTFPTNFGTVKANTLFTAKMAVNNLVTGNFVNAQENYFAAPQQLDKNGVIIGHTHFVIEQLTAIDQTAPTDPGTFIFFKGINGAAVGGVVSTDVTDGVPEGVFRMCSINSAANHQPVIVPVAQHGWLDDCSYFFATADGTPPAAAGAASGAAANSTAAAGAAASASAATGKLNVSASAVASASAVPVSKGAVASASAAPVGKGAAAASSAAPVGKGAAAASSAVATAKGTAATAAATNKAAQGSTGGKGLGDTVVGGFNPLANPAAAKSSVAAVKGAATPAAVAAKGAATSAAAAAKGAATSAAAAAKGAATAAAASSKDAAKGAAAAAGAAASKSQAIKSDKGAKN